MSAALSGGQEITSAFSRSLYYATSPGTPALPRTYIHGIYTQIHTQTDIIYRQISHTYTHAHTKLLRILTLSRFMYVRICLHVYVGAQPTRSQDEAASYVGTYLPTYLPEPEIHMYTNGVCTARYGRDTSG